MRQTIETKPSVPSPSQQIKMYQAKIKEFEKKIKAVGITPRKKSITDLNQRVKKGGKLLEQVVKSGSKAKETRRNNLGPLRRA